MTEHALNSESGERVVLVEDCIVALEWAKEALGAFGFEVVTYNASLGIQSFVRKTQPRVVLLDVSMPALEGELVCRMLKDSVETRDVIVALYSAMSENELGDLAAKSGADGYIVKTNDVAELAVNLQTLIDSSH